MVPIWHTLSSFSDFNWNHYQIFCSHSVLYHCAVNWGPFQTSPISFFMLFSLFLHRFFVTFSKYQWHVPHCDWICNVESVFKQFIHVFDKKKQHNFSLIQDLLQPQMKLNPSDWYSVSSHQYCLSPLFKLSSLMLQSFEQISLWSKCIEISSMVSEYWHWIPFRLCSGEENHLHV